MTKAEVQSSTFAVTITATTEIDATPGRVWQVLTDTMAYPQWNPFIRRLEGQLVVGAKLSVDLQPDPEKKPQTMRPRITQLHEGHNFTWLGHVGIPKLLDGRHSFTVEPSGTGTRLTQHEVLSGLLTPLFRSMLTESTPAAFVASNDALAARATS